MKIAMTSIAYILLFIFSAYSQENPPANKKEVLNMPPELLEGPRRTVTPVEKKKTKAPSEISAKAHIRQLKNAVLLVRLRTSENAIKSLEKGGNNQMAATVRRRQEAENKRLITAFQQHFNFCPVYFFFSTDTDKILTGHFKGVFINENLQPAPDPEIAEKNFYVAEITDLEQYRPEPDDLNASNNAEVSFKALVIRDNNFYQLNKPFPYFIKASQNIPPRKRSEPEMVMLLNEKLEAYYKASLKNGKR